MSLQVDSLVPGNLINHTHPATDIIGEIPVSAMSFKGAYDNATDYTIGDSVSYNGSSYVMFNEVGAGTVPTNASYWQIVAQKGETGATGAQGVQGLKGDKGDAGASGTNGTDGVGVPTGGTTGQILAKNSNTDYDTEWIDPPTSGSGISEALAIVYATVL